jgi:uncharacterized protein YbaA (DUF1428 family)
MAKYVDGFVIPIPKENVEKYRKIAQAAGEVWKEYGALEYFECIGDDLEHENMISFPKLANASDEETVIFAWIVFESKEARDKINEAVMNDPRIKDSMDPCDNTFDYKQMAYGGFKSIVEL